MARTRTVLALGVLLLAVSPIVAVALYGQWVRPWTTADAVVDDTSERQLVELTTDDTRMLFVLADGTIDDPQCAVYEHDTELELLPVEPITVTDIEDAAWVGLFTFDPDATKVEISCAGPDADRVMVGSPPRFDDALHAFLATAAVVLAVAGLGACLLIGARRRQIAGTTSDEGYEES